MIVFCVLLVFLQIHTQIFAETCEAPNDKIGDVKPLVFCPQLLKLFTNPRRSMTDYLSVFLRNATIEPVVCCINSSLDLSYFEDTKTDYGKVSIDDYDYQLSSGYWFSNIEEVPWIVGILRENLNSSSNLRCSGTLINQRYVITAAECVTPESLKTEVVIRKDNRGSITDHIYEVEELIVHPFFNIVPGLNNIALIRLSESIYLKGINRGIVLPVLQTAEDNAILQSSSWLGRINNEKVSNHKLLSNQECRQEFAKVNSTRNITDYDMCTKVLNATKSNHPQSYEIGGPLMYKNNTHYLIGVVSSSVENDVLPKVHARIDKYLNWIEYNMREYTKTCKIGNQFGQCVPSLVCPHKIHYIASDNRINIPEFFDNNECDSLRLHCCDTTNPRPEPKRPPYQSRTLINYTDCGISNNTFLNINNINIRNFPWLVEIAAFNRFQSIHEETLCGGVFLNNRVVLTTAKCLNLARDKWENTVVRYARTNKKLTCSLNSCFDYDEADSLNLISHHFYDELSNFNDIGLILLAETVPQSEFTSHICIREADELSPQPGDTLYIYDLSNSIIKNSYAIESTLISNAECQQLYKEKNRTNIISTYHMCSVLKQSVSCDYLLGGVLMFSKRNRWYVAGVGMLNCERGLPVIHTNAQKYLKWMENYISGDGSCSTEAVKTGECVFLHECPEYRDVMANPQDLSVWALEKFLCEKRSYENLKVCCNRSKQPIRFDEMRYINFNRGGQMMEKKTTLKDYCGYQHPDDYAVHHIESTLIDEYPWLAIVFHVSTRRNKLQAICGGSIINVRYIITGAHCVSSNTDSPVSLVRLGEFYVKNDTDCILHPEYIGKECTSYSDYGIEKLIPHPFFSNAIRGVSNDIGLIRVDRNIMWTEYIRPICLPNVESQPKFGRILYASGFGKISSARGADLATLKKRVPTILISNKECKQRILLFHLNIRLSDYDMCTIDFLNGTDFTCPGDGGGPLMYRYKSQWYLVGILSHGAHCGQGKPEIHTKVFKYLQWIKDTMLPE